MSLANPKVREQIDILFGEPQSGLRQAIRTALHREGYKRVVDFDRLEGVREAVKRGPPDVMILDARMEGDGREVAALLKQLRFNRIGSNPFVNIIVTLWDPNQALVRAMVDAGCDDLLAKPISPGLIIERINILATHRKPFVVTSDYIGPDRRKDPGRGAEIPQIAVPNTLQSKAGGKPVPPVEIQKMIEEAQAQINDQKLKRNAFQICFLVGLVLPVLRSGTLTAETPSQLDRLLGTAADIQERMEGTEYGHVAELCGTLIQVVVQLREHMAAPSQKDIDLLEPLSHAVLIGFNPQGDGRLMAAQISAAVSKFEAKKAQAAFEAVKTSAAHPAEGG